MLLLFTAFEAAADTTLTARPTALTVAPALPTVHLSAVTFARPQTVAAQPVFPLVVAVGVATLQALPDALIATPALPTVGMIKGDLVAPVLPLSLRPLLAEGLHILAPLPPAVLGAPREGAARESYRALLFSPGSAPVVLPATALDLTWNDLAAVSAPEEGAAPPTGEGPTTGGSFSQLHSHTVQTEHPAGSGAARTTVTTVAQSTEERRQRQGGADVQSEQIWARALTYQSVSSPASPQGETTLTSVVTRTDRMTTPGQSTERIVTSTWANGRLSFTAISRRARTGANAYSWQSTTEDAVTTQPDGGYTTMNASSRTRNWQDPLTIDTILADEAADADQVTVAPTAVHTMRLTVPGAQHILPQLLPHFLQVASGQATIALYRLERRPAGHIQETVAVMRLVRWRRVTTARADTLTLECETPVAWHQAVSRTARHVFSWNDTAAEIFPEWGILPGDLLLNGVDPARRFLVGTVSLGLSPQRAVMRVSAREGT